MRGVNWMGRGGGVSAGDFYYCPQSNGGVKGGTRQHLGGRVGCQLCGSGGCHCHLEASITVHRVMEQWKSEGRNKTAHIGHRTKDT